ncbi:MAG: TIGR03905 family TSCPD domain-containing protein [Bacteroidaceae bacterium]|nr:TIGR03905 family TSCPD domain-containing protein [Bacteroidaceae bacterium]MBQ2073428.1 TIGR03905 family TSCPD domain-containing protein [Bacteroidaceae bacterium]MBR6845948.1 TIGR03905 family TSCPD domain-containing protein [Bacteroidaceae bacterium]
MKKYTYKTQGTCSQAIEITVDDDNRIDSVQFIGGCDGNTKGISSLVRGMKVQDVIAKLRGITCGYKSTSCPDQLSKALEAML